MNQSRFEDFAPNSKLYLQTFTNTFPSLCCQQTQTYGSSCACHCYLHVKNHLTAVNTDIIQPEEAHSCSRVCKHTDGQISDEEVGDGSQGLEAIDDVDDQRITQNPQHNDGAVGQDQHHLQTHKSK